MSRQNEKIIIRTTIRHGRQFAISALIFVVLFSLCGCKGAAEPARTRVVSGSEIKEEESYYILEKVKRGDLVNGFSLKCTYDSSEVQEATFQIPNEKIDGIYVGLGDSVEKGDLIAQLDIKKDQEALQDLVYEGMALKEELQYLENVISLTKEEKNMEYGTTIYEDAELNADISKKDELNALIQINQMEQSEQENKIGRKQIRAEIKGTVTAVVQLAEGELSNVTKIYAKIAGSEGVFRVKTKDWKYYPVGTKETINVNIIGDQWYEYEAEVVGVEENEAQEEKEVQFRLLSSSGEISNGSFGVIDHIIEEKKGILYIPMGCVSGVDGKTIVYVVNKNGIREQREITTGINDGESIEVLSGLKEGEQVIQ